MTYDPLSYGQIKLRDRAAAPGETPDDLLFEDAGPAPQLDAPDQGNTDWELLADAAPMSPDPANAMQADQFGTDVLGETVPTSEPSPRGASPIGASPVAPAPAPQQDAPGLRSTPSVTKAPASKAPASKPRRPINRRRYQPASRSSRLVGALLPFLIIAGGGSASAWLYMMEQNMVMAGLVGAISLVGAALARVMFR